MKVGRALTHVGESSSWWVADFINYGAHAYGVTTAYDLAQQATGRGRRNLQYAALVARRFEPKRRVAALTFNHHGVVAKYAPEIVDELLAEAIELGYTCKQLRLAAEERCGHQKAKRLRVRLRIDLWPESVDRLRELSDGHKLNWFVAGIVEEWLRSHGQDDCIPKRPTTAERRQRWEAEGLCIWCGSNAADDEHRTCANCRANVNDWQKWNKTERKRLPEHATPAMAERSH
jgi:hypothetical protein